MPSSSWSLGLQSCRGCLQWVSQDDFVWEKEAVGVKRGGPVCWHQQTDVKSLQNEQASSGARTAIKKAFLS